MKTTSKILSNILSLYLIIIYFINAVAEKTSAEYINNYYYFLVFALWVGVFLFAMQIIISCVKISFKSAIVISVILTALSLLIYFLGLNIIVPIFISLCSGVMFIYSFKR